jgi:hypothetical protein
VLHDAVAGVVVSGEHHVVYLHLVVHLHRNSMRDRVSEFVLKLPPHQVDHLLAILARNYFALVERTLDVAPLAAAVEAVDSLLESLVVRATHTFQNHRGRHEDPDFRLAALLAVAPEGSELPNGFPVHFGGLLVDDPLCHAGCESVRAS